MKTSTCAVLTSGVAALSVGAVVVASSTPPGSMRTVEVLRPVSFAADSLPFASDVPVEPPSDDDLDSALALIEQLAPVSDGRVVTVRMNGDDHPGTVTIAPAVPNAAAEAELEDGSPDDIASRESLDEPTPLNAASDVIDSVYSVSRYWANYVSLELGPWLINWVPLGYLLSDQIYIWYPDFVLPTVDSFVYDFLDPVVEDPFNLEVWFEGIGAIANTAASGVAEGLRNEINYIVTFGWFPIPLPPLPSFPLPGLASSSTSAAVAASSTEADEAATDATEDSGATGIGEVATKQADTDTTDEATPALPQEGAIEEAGDDTEASAAEDQPADYETADVEAVEDSATESNDEPSVETGDTTQDEVQGPVDDAPDTADESGDSGDADEPGDAERSADAEQSDDAELSGDTGQSDDAEQSGDTDAGNDTAQDSGSGSDEKPSDTDSGEASGSDG